MTKNLLHHPDAITEVLTCRPCGLMTDVDGTISDIAPRPTDAIVSDSCRAGLASLAGSLDLVAVVSGRPVQEALRMVGLPDLVYVGDHGLERMRDGKVFIDPLAASYQEKVRAAAMELFRVLSPKPDLEGLFLEDKRQSFSFHYRQCPDPVKARRLILEALSRLDAARGLQITEARRSVEVRPPLKVNKGTVLEDLAVEFGLRGSFYLGDDYTDITAFRALKAWRAVTGRKGLAVAVVSLGSPEEARTEADFILKGAPQVGEFLGLLFRLWSLPGPGGPTIDGKATRRGLQPR